MLISLNELIKKYNVSIKGILHVGAHECEEMRDYEKYVTINKILWIEALPNKVEISKQKYPGVIIENAAVSDVEETVKFNVSNNGQSSSMLELGLHKVFHPEVKYVNSFNVKTKLLKHIISNYDISFNFLNLDIQGAELKALKGMEEYLHNIDYIYTEVNSDYVYKDCAIVGEIDEYLIKFGLHRVETVWYNNCRWGDAFYIRT
jgi:FkbM family methyltransferase